MFFKRTS